MNYSQTQSLKDEIGRLQVTNQALNEELTQLQADKEFVWSLWRRMQVVNPSIAQAVGMVVQREKEKSEMKDQKVLQILQVKDDQIAENNKIIAELQEKLGKSSSRSISDSANKEKVEELQIRNKELQLRKEETERLLEEEITKSKSREKCLQEQLQRIANEKSELEINVESLSQRIIKAQEEIDKLQEVRVKGLERDVQRLERRLIQTQDEVKVKCEALSQSESIVMRLKQKINKSDGELHIARSELSEVKASHQHGLQHSAQQAELIRQLQALQHDTQQVIKSQEDVHHIHTSSYEKMYIDVKSKYDKLVLNEKLMEKKLKEMMIPAVSTNNAETQVDSTATGTQVGSTASKTQVGSTATGTQVGSTASKTQVGSTAPGTQVGSTASNTRQASFTPEQIPITPHSHPQPLVVDHHRLLLAGDRVERSSRPRYRSQTFSGISVNDIHYSGLDAGTTMDEQIRHNLGRKEKKVLEENYERKMSDLRKLLKLKNEELETMRKVHKKRFDRLKILQENCSILREQISTYDEEELKTLNSRKHVKTSSKQLQQLNSDTVWNDLTFYKEKYTQLNNERIDIHEEIDTLQVQTTADASTIADLSRCLEQERLKLQACFEKEHKNLQIFQKEQRIFDDQLKKNKLLKQQLQQERNENKKLISDQIQLEREARSARADLCTVKTDFLSKETEVQHNKQEIHKLKRKMKRKNKKWKQYKADKHLAIKTPKQHQLFLNKSILKMRKVFPEFEDNEWEDVQSDSDDVVSSNPESLGQQIMRSANKLSRRNLSGLVKSPKSPRELISVETYLRRMAKAYKGKEAEHTIQISVATQTERVQEAEIRFLKESLLEKNDEIASMTDSEGSSLSTIVTSSPKVERQHTATSPHLPLPKLQKLLVKTYCGKAGLTDQNICSLKNRLASLQQQVIATKRSKRILQQSVEQLTAKCELLQADLSLSNQRLKISKETIKRLTREVEQNNDEAELVRQQVEMCCKRQTSSTKQPKHTDTDWKELELRAKNQSIELSQRNVVVKTLKSEIESQAQQIKTLQDRISHNERDLNQKRSLMEDLRARVKASTNKDKSDNVYLKDLEDKLQDVSDACEKRKVEVNSLRKRLTTVTKEKHTYEVVNQQLQDELKTFKAELRKKTTEKNEADKMVVDLEATAVNQLQSMSEHIEKVIASAEKKIEQEVLKHSQLKLVLEMLAGEFLNRTKDARELAHQIKKSLCVKVKMDESMTKAQSIASSILYLTASDVEELMTLEDAEEHKRLEKELIKERRKDEEWMKLLESLINSQTPLAQKVFQMLMDKIIEHDKLLSKVEKETT